MGSFGLVGVQPFEGTSSSMSIAGHSISQFPSVCINRRHLRRRKTAVAFHFFRIRNNVIGFVSSFVVLRLQLVLTRLHFLPADALVLKIGRGALSSFWQVVLRHQTEASRVDHSLFGNKAHVLFSQIFLLPSSLKAARGSAFA
jgi:hypothetical protein